MSAQGERCSSFRLPAPFDKPWQAKRNMRQLALGLTSLLCCCTSGAWAASVQWPSDSVIRHWALEKRGLGLFGPEKAQQVSKLKVSPGCQAAAVDARARCCDCGRAQRNLHEQGAWCAAGRDLGIRLAPWRGSGFCCCVRCAWRGVCAYDSGRPALCLSSACDNCPPNPVR